MESGLSALKSTVEKYGNSIHGKQAQDDINQFPEYVINKAESLGRRWLKRQLKL